MNKIILLGICLICISFKINSQPVAAFSADLTIGCTPLTAIQFTDESTSLEDIASWAWEINGIPSSSTQHPSFDFTIEGVYDICLTVTDDLGVMDNHCEVAYITILETPFADAGLDFVLDCTTTTVTLNASGSSSGTGITYEWIDPNGMVISTDIITEVFLSGIYTLVVTSSGLCSASDEVIVSEDFVIPTVQITLGSPCVMPYVLTSTGSSSGPEFAYEWLDEVGAVLGTSPELEVSVSGIYTLIIFNIVNGCYSEDIIEVSDPIFDPVIVNGSVQDVFCNGDSDGAIDVFVTGGLPPFQFEWSNGSMTEDLSGLSAGTYTVTVTDDSACSSVSSYVIFEPSPLQLSFSTTCATASTGGTASAIVFGGTAPYFYEWNTGVEASTINNLSTGIYEITVTDPNGCTIYGSVEIGTAIEAILGGDSTYCDNGQAQLQVIAPNALTYNWSSGNLSCYDCPNPIATTGLGEETFYSVTVTEADGCIDVGYLNFNVQSYLDFDLLEFSNSPVFAGEEIQLNCNVNNPISVNWTGPGSFNSTDCSPTISNATIGNAGTYSVDIVDQYGCSASSNPDVIIYGIIESITNDTSVCEGGAIQLEVIAPTATSIIWSPAVGLDDPNISNPIAIPSAPIFYTVTVENANGDIEQASVFIDMHSGPIIVSPTVVSCSGDLIGWVADGLGGPLLGTFLWTASDGTTSTTDSHGTIGVAPEVCVTLIYTDLNGCVFEEEACTDVYGPIIQNPVTDTICRTESVELSLITDEPASYEWSPTQDLSCSNCENPIATLLETTSFSVTVTDDASGCTEIASVEVFVDQNCVWPGDTDTNFVVNNFDLLNIGLAYDSVGPLRPDANLNWMPQPMDDWIQSTPGGINYKHIDCDGNGLINSDDTLAITQNWEFTHAFTGDNETGFSGSNYPQAAVLQTAPFYIDVDTLIENETYALPIILGEENDQVEDVYGLAFSLEYDSSIVVQGSTNVAIEGWIGSLNDDMIAIQKTFDSPGRVDVGITRIDGLPISGFGQIGLLYITIEDDVLLRADNDDREGDEFEVYFNISNVLIINHLGEEIPVVPMETSTTLDETVNTSEINWDEHIQIQPNPVDEVIFITSKNIELQSLSLFSISGKLLNQWTPSYSSAEMDMSQLEPGTYLLKVQTAVGVIVKKILVMR